MAGLIVVVRAPRRQGCGPRGLLHWRGVRGLRYIAL